MLATRTGRAGWVGRPVVSGRTRARSVGRPRVRRYPSGFLRLSAVDIPPTRPPDACVDLTTTTDLSGGALPNFTVTMTCDGVYAGECVSHSVGHYSHAPEAQRTLFTTWLGVADERRDPAGASTSSRRRCARGAGSDTATRSSARTHRTTVPYSSTRTSGTASRTRRHRSAPARDLGASRPRFTDAPTRAIMARPP